MLPCFNILTGSGKIHNWFFCLWIQYVRTNKKKVSPANQFSELFCFSWFSTDVNWSQYSEHAKHREIRKLFNKDFWSLSGICANFSLQSLPIIQIQKMLLEKIQALRSQNCLESFRKFRIFSEHTRAYASYALFASKFGKLNASSKQLLNFQSKNWSAQASENAPQRSEFLFFQARSLLKLCFL